MSDSPDLQRAAKRVVNSVSPGVRQRVEKARKAFAQQTEYVYVGDLDRPVQIPMRAFVALVNAVEGDPS